MTGEVIIRLHYGWNEFEHTYRHTQARKNWIDISLQDALDVVITNALIIDAKFGIVPPGNKLRFEVQPVQVGKL